MRLGIMQPYFFPYLGYFAIVEHTDKFIFFDTPQYMHHGWVNRNRIINSKNEISYMVVPVKKAKQSTPIKDIVIDNSQKWKEKLYGQLTVYKKKAPNYNKIIELLHELIDKEYTNLSNLNIMTTIRICEYLNMKTDFSIYSEMEPILDVVEEPDEWALYISKREAATTYVNPPGGMDLFDKKKYKDKNIELEFLQINITPYIQKIGRFEAGLSIIDVIMFCEIEEVKQMLQDYITLGV